MELRGCLSAHSRYLDDSVKTIRSHPFSVFVVIGVVGVRAVYLLDLLLFSGRLSMTSSPAARNYAGTASCGVYSYRKALILTP